MDTLERLITELRRDKIERDPSPERDHFTDQRGDASCPEDPWLRLAHLEARLRSSDTPHDEHISLTESDYSRGRLSTPSASLDFNVDWALVNQELLQRGLPPVLDFESEDGLPTPEAAHTALQSALRELTRLHRQADSLKAAADLASQMEAATLKKLHLEAQNIPKVAKEWQSLATKAQEDAARAKESEMASRHAVKEAAVEAAALKTSLDRLQRQVFAKASENEALKQQIQDHLDKQTQVHLAAKESVKRIRQVFAAERVNAPQSRSALIAQPSNYALLSTVNALQVAKVYESQLRAAEEETRTARAETLIVREKLEAQLSKQSNSSQGISSLYSNEVNIAAKKVAKAESLAALAQEEAERLREEVSQRPAVEQWERLQRQNEILTRRLARLEKERESFATRNNQRAASTATSTSTNRHQQRQSQLSRQVVLELLESTANTLDCPDILELPKIARQLQRSLTSIPALQNFVDTVCQAVFRQGSFFVPWSLRSREEPSDVPAILSKWISMLEEAEELQDQLKEQQQQRQEKHNTLESKNPVNDKSIGTSVGRKQKQPNIITVSRVAAGQGFPEIEIFAPASRNQDR